VLPNFLIIGAEKSATTWLHARLTEHPDIFLPRTKEIHFFNRCNSNLVPRDNYQLGLNWYERFFRDARGFRAAGEATPMYLCDRVAPARIRQHLPHARLICCLRNPIDRAYSHYWMAFRKGHTTDTFADVVRAREPRFIERGQYARQLSTYLRLFDRPQILVLIYEEIDGHPSAMLRRICAFLDVDANHYADAADQPRAFSASSYRSRRLLQATHSTARWMRRHYPFGEVLDVLKSTGIPRWIKESNRKPEPYPPLESGLRAELAAYYRAEVHDLQQLLGRSVDAWRDWDHVPQRPSGPRRCPA
jgi:hypothetical protein